VGVLEEGFPSSATQKRGRSSEKRKLTAMTLAFNELASGTGGGVVTDSRSKILLGFERRTTEIAWNKKGWPPEPGGRSGHHGGAVEKIYIGTDHREGTLGARTIDECGEKGGTMRYSK